MRIIGIITEFNPFHYGHKYFIETIRQQYHPDGIVGVMSGSFVQRGEPAICSKWARTHMALTSGVDLIIELPFAFAVRSAYPFALGAIRLLASTGVVTHLAFGSESGQLEELQTITRLLSEENPVFKRTLRQALDEGHSFPAARAAAVKASLPEVPQHIDHLLSGPNNILALEYLRVLHEEKMDIIPLTIPRIGAGYKEEDTGSCYPSATAIRSAIRRKYPLDELAALLPAESMHILYQEMKAGRAPISSDQLEQIILYKLRTASISELQQIHEVSEGLEHRIKETAMQVGTLEELRQEIKSKRYSMSRIDRILLYALFTFTNELAADFDQAGPLYHHLLGFSSSGQKVLQQMHNKSTIPIFNRGSDLKYYWHNGEPMLRDMLGLDLAASNVYTLLYPQASQRKAYSDFTTSPLRYNTNSV